MTGQKRTFEENQLTDFGHIFKIFSPAQLPMSFLTKWKQFKRNRFAGRKIVGNAGQETVSSTHNNRSNTIPVASV